MCIYLFHFVPGIRNVKKQPRHWFPDRHTHRTFKGQRKKIQKVYFYILFLIYDSLLKRGYKQTPSSL